MNTFVCNWKNASGDNCHNTYSNAEEYCKWHLMAKRIDNIWRSEEKSTVDSFIFLFVPFVILFHALNYLVIFNSGILGDIESNSNPFFFIVLFGLFFIFFGKTISITRKKVFPEWFNKTKYFWYFLSFLIVFLLSQYSVVEFPITFFDYLKSRLGILRLMAFIIPIGLMLHEIERKTSYISPVLIIIGLILLFVAGIITPIYEIFHQYFGGKDIHAYLPKDNRDNIVEFLIVFRLPICMVAIDGFIALVWKGYLYSLFKINGSPYTGIISEHFSMNKKGILELLYFLFLVQGQGVVFLIFCSLFVGLAVHLATPQILGAPFLDMLIIITIHFFVAKKINTLSINESS